MHNVALSWQQAAGLTAVLALLAAGLRFARRPRLRCLAPFAGEAALIAGLYSVWQLAGTLSVLGAQGAFSRAQWIAQTEHSWHLPAESSVQHLVIGHPLITQAANLYYATMHFGALFVFLIWLFVAHRDSYRRVRRVVALATLVCLVIQLVPVAPPRLLHGYVDTASLYGQSVYNLGVGDQLSAMPSVHVAWAVLIGWVVARVAGGPMRCLGAAHAALTVFVVVATANHFWLDGLVAVLVLAASAGAELAAWEALRRLCPVPEPGADLSTDPIPVILR